MLAVDSAAIVDNDTRKMLSTFAWTSPISSNRLMLSFLHETCPLYPQPAAAIHLFFYLFKRGPTANADFVL